MMKPYTLKEFAQQLRMDGCEFADEILDLIDLETDVAEPYWELVGNIEYSAPDDLKDKPAKALERLNDRSEMLDEIEKQFDEDGRTGDTDDQVKALLETLAVIRTVVGAGTATDEDLETLIEELVERAARAPEPMEYDL